MTFQEYSSVYDSLYHDKDYAAETDFIEAIFGRHAQVSPKTILDLGCGSGGHILELVRRGYDVTGVDCSTEMLSLAKRKSQSLGLSVDLHNEDIRLLVMDARTIAKKMDAKLKEYSRKARKMARSLEQDNWK